MLGKQQAVEAGAYEAWMVDGEGFVTEGTSTNAWIVTAKGEVVTRKADTAILHGMTRSVLRDTVGKRASRSSSGRSPWPRPRRRAEAFLTSTTSAVMPVVKIDSARIGDGKPGPVTRADHGASGAERRWR